MMRTVSRGNDFPHGVELGANYVLEQSIWRWTRRRRDWALQPCSPSWLSSTYENMTSICGKGAWEFAKILPAAKLFSRQRWLIRVLSERPGRPVACRGRVPSAGWKSSRLSLCPRPTLHSINLPSSLRWPSFWEYKGTSLLWAQLCQQSQISALWCLPSFPGEHPKPPLTLEYVGHWESGGNGSMRDWKELNFPHSLLHSSLPLFQWK